MMMMMMTIETSKIPNRFFSRAWLWSPPVEHCVSLKFLLQYGNSSVVSGDGHGDGDGGDGDHEEDYAISYCWEY